MQERSKEKECGDGQEHKGKGKGGPQADDPIFITHRKARLKGCRARRDQRGLDSWAAISLSVYGARGLQKAFVES
jgi:hypothetical protein